MLASDPRLWRVVLQRRQPYHFLLLRFFDWRPRSKDIDCNILMKISKILAGADILSTPKFLTFLHGRLIQISRYSVERVRP
jgi:hypothetical protein